MATDVWRNLLQAYEKENYQQFEQILSDGDEVDKLADMKQMLLHFASRDGAVHILHLLLQTHDIKVDGVNDTREAKNLFQQFEDLPCSQYETDYYLDHNCQFHSHDGPSCRTALMHASSHGHQVCVGILLEAGASVTFTDRHGTTALMLACQRGHSHCVSLLLTHRQDITLRDKRGRSALDYACEGGDKQCIQHLIHVYNLQKKSLESSLRQAEEEGNRLMIRKLQAAMSCAEKVLVDAARTVMRSKEDIVSKCMLGKIVEEPDVLIICSACEQFELFKELLDIFKKTVTCELLCQCVSMTTRRRRYHTLNNLLQSYQLSELAYNTSLPRLDGCTLLTYTLTRGYGNGYSHDDTGTLLNLIYQRGADPNIMDGNGCTPLVALLSVIPDEIPLGRRELVRLIRMGADPNVKGQPINRKLIIKGSRQYTRTWAISSSEIMSPLQMTAFRGNLVYLRVIWEAGGDYLCSNFYTADQIAQQTESCSDSGNCQAESYDRAKCVVEALSALISQPRSLLQMSRTVIRSHVRARDAIKKLHDRLPKLIIDYLLMTKLDDISSEMVTEQDTFISLK